MRRGLAATLAEARAFILAGEVWCGSERVGTAGERVPAGAEIDLRPRGRRYASRGGDKLAGALAALRVDPAGRRCLDVGASTGGFTDCLLQHGALAVTALDVGRGQLDLKLRDDPRVSVVEGKNARHIEPGELGAPFDLVTMDVSFISAATLVAVTAPLLARPAGDMLVLVKPQFEARRCDVGPGGIVRDPEVAERAVASVVQGAASAGLRLRGRTPSPLRGARGNQEHFVHLGW